MRDVRKWKWSAVLSKTIKSELTEQIAHKFPKRETTRTKIYRHFLQIYFSEI